MKETFVGLERLGAARKREDEYLAREVERGDEQASKKRKSDEAARLATALTSTAGGGEAAPSTAHAPDQRHSQPVTSLPSSSSSSLPPPFPSSSTNVVPFTVSDDMAVSQSPGEKRSREIGDEGDQDLHLDKDVEMSMLAFEVEGLRVSC